LEPVPAEKLADAAFRAQAKTRYQQRNHRLQQEKQAADVARQAKKGSVDPTHDPVAAALARIKAKKAETSTPPP
jgi:Na+-translocating ferredoxin:NAD+ oxidoreductase RnfC subunit